MGRLPEHRVRGRRRGRRAAHRAPARRRLAPALAISLVTLSAGLILTAFTGALGLVIVLLALAGGGRAVLAVSANTMLQRVVPAHLVGRVFGIVEGLSMAGLAAGALLARCSSAWAGRGWR